MKLLVSICFFIAFNSNFGQEDGEPQFTVRGGAKVKGADRYTPKRKASDCNNDLEFDQGNKLVYHKKTRKPYTGTWMF